MGERAHRTTIRCCIRKVVIALIFLLSLDAARAQPRIFWANDPVEPNETVMVSGMDLDEVQSVEIDQIFLQNSNHKAAQVLVPFQLTKNSLKFIIPPDMQSGVYKYSLRFKNI